MLLRPLSRPVSYAIKPSQCCKRSFASSYPRSITSAARPILGTFTETNQHPVPQGQQTRSATAHAISNPTLAGIEKRWEGMPPQEQAQLWMQLRDRMKVNWHKMTLQEKKAAWWIAFGPHGPRAQAPPGEWTRIWLYTFAGVGVSLVLYFIIHSFARPPPRTMTKEWQEATNEYLKQQQANPIYGISSEGYTGKGHVQSPPEKKS